MTEQPSNRTHPRNRGFMLMEVLVAVAILSVALVVLLDSIRSSIESNKITKERTQAVFLAQTKMWDMENLLFWKSDYDTFDAEGSFDPPFSHFEYEIDIESDEDVSEHFVTIVVGWYHGKRYFTYSLVGVIPMDRGERYLVS